MSNPTWHRLQRKQIYDNPWIRVYHDDIIDPNGNKGIYGSIHFKNYAIAIIPLDDNNNTYLVGQQRYTIQNYSWELPMGGGLIVRDPKQAARQELREEIGMNCGELTLFQTLFTSNSITDEKAIIYIARDLKPINHEVIKDNSEKLAIKKIPIEKAIEMALNGEINDAVSVAALLKFKIHY